MSPEELPSLQSIVTISTMYIHPRTFLNPLMSLRPICGFSTTLFFLVHPVFSFSLCRENAFHQRAFCDPPLWPQAIDGDTGSVFSLGFPVVPWSETGCLPWRGS